MLILGAQTIALLIVVPALCFFVGKWLFTKDTEIEARRKAAMTITAKLEGMGLKRLVGPQGLLLGANPLESN